jgi:hypothetical protein
MPNLNQSQADALRFYTHGIKVGPKASTAYTSTIAQTLFTIVGGKVWVSLFMGTVTTLHAGATQNIKTQTAPTTGTAVALSTDTDTNALEAGGTLYVPGTGGATIKANGGVVLAGTAPRGFIATTGTITFTPSATQSGASSWELWYIPIDDGAYVT